MEAYWKWKASFSRAVLFAICAVAVQASAAEAFPARTVQIIVGFAPGGLPDIGARLIAPALAELWKQQVVVENRPGAGSTVAARTVAESAPDGHMLLATTSAHAAASALYGRLAYDPAQDFAGVAVMGITPMLLVAAPSIGVRSVKDLIALAKSKPGQLNFSSAGIGSNTHFAMEVFKATAGIDIVHVAYKGIPEALTDTMTGRVQLFMAPLGNAIAQVKEGKLAALGVTSAHRFAQLPDVPTIDEAGVAYRWEAWFGLLAPAKTPRAIVARLHSDVMRTLNRPEAQKRWDALGADPSNSTPEQFDQTIRDDIAIFARAARAAQIKPE